MKKSILLLTAGAFLAGAVFTGCASSSDEAGDAQGEVALAESNVAQANKDLDEAREDYMKDIENYRRDVDAKTAANDKIIADLKARIDLQKKETKEAYRNEIANLEQKNAEMKTKMNEYKAQGKENWDKFKTDFNSSMDNLGNAFKDLTARDSK